MQEPDFIFDIFLQPGEIYWGDFETRIRTLLGSCVAICLWHPKLRIGGMSHSLLPVRKIPAEKPGPDPRYVSEAVEMFKEEVLKAGTRPSEYVVKIFGGGSFIKEDIDSIGSQNIKMTRTLLDQNGFQIYNEHLGGMMGRNIILQLWNGEVWLKKIQSGG